MSSQNFVHLHVHSDASVLDGMRPIEKTVQIAKEGGFETFALTDHGTLSNWVRYYHACKENGLKPVFGVEAYFADGKRDDKKAKTHHITLLAKNKAGYDNLIAITSEAHRTGFVRKPRIDWELVGDHSEGIICLSGCRAGLVSRQLGEGSMKGATKKYDALKEIFGDNLWLEIMFVGIKDDVTTDSVRLGKREKSQFVITNDVHYPSKDDGDYHDLLIAIGTKTRLNDKKAMRFSSHEFWMKTDDEISAAWRRFNSDIPRSVFEQGFQATRDIFDSIESFEVTKHPDLPVPPYGFKASPEKALRKLAMDGMEKRGYAGNREAMDRLKTELEVIVSMGFTNYFLILWELTRFCRKNDILYGPRGSGAGSFTLFCLGVIDIDPIENKLNFARFLNKARKEYPDVDMDFETTERHRVLEHLVAVYGENKVAPIASFSTLQTKAVVKDVARSLDIPSGIATKLADEFEVKYDMSVFDPYEKQYPLLAGAVERFTGQQRHMSKHAGGVVISGTDLGNQMPVQRSGGQILAAWSEGGVKNLSSMGFVKFDLLGLSTLSIIKSACRYAGIEPKLRSFPIDDKNVAKAFAEGHTVGIFQFESDGITKLLKDIGVTEIGDVIAANALYRPGALDAGTTWKYAEWKRKPRKIHPLVDSVLGETYGVITYQEQVIALYAALTGSSPEDADLVRRLILKKPEKGDPDWEAKIKEKRIAFLKGAIGKGIKKDVAKELWKEIMTHTRYSFNKAHAASYSWLAWICMYLKINYPKEYLTALLNNGGDPKKVMREAVRLGVKIKSPHINHSKIGFSPGKDGIYVGLEAIKGIGSKAAVSIAENAPYKDVEDFMAKVELRVVNVRARAALFSLDAFSGLKGADPETVNIEKSSIIASNVVAQSTLLGFIIPGNVPDGMSAKIDAMNRAEGTTHTIAGLVSSVRKRTISTGDMAYVTMVTPRGNEKDVIFWPDVFRKSSEKLKEGSIACVVTKYSVHPKYGRQWVAQAVKEIK